MQQTLKLSRTSAKRSLRAFHNSGPVIPSAMNLSRLNRSATSGHLWIKPRGHLTLIGEYMSIRPPRERDQQGDRQLMNRVRNATAVAVLALVALTFGLSPKAGAQPSQKQLDLAAAKADQKALVGANMSLTPDESAKFWPLYEQYEAAMEKVEERHIKEVKDFAQSYDSLTEADAQKKLDEVIAIQQARLDTQKEYIPKFR